jgi:hypothetical protein
MRKGATQGELYLQHPLLSPLATDGSEYGANGIRFHEGALYVTNSSRALLLKIDPREAAPEPKLLVNAAELATVDDFAFGCDGSAYLASFLDDRVLRMTPQGVFSTVVDNSYGLLRQPSAVAFSSTGELYVTNSALFFTGPASVVRLPSP